MILVIAAGASLAIALSLTVSYSTTLGSQTTGTSEDGVTVPSDSNGITNGTDIGISPVASTKLSCEPADRSNERENSTTTTITTDEYAIGNLIGMPQHPEVTAQILRDEGEKVSFRFTAKYAGDIQSLTINLFGSSRNQTNYQVGLQEDDGAGKPSGDWVAPPVQGTGLADTIGFETITLSDPARLYVGKVYHLVIEMTGPPIDTKNPLRIRSFDIFAPYQPFNDGNPVMPWPDEMMNVLYFDGGIWKEENNWPVFVGQYVDGRTFGQPYSLLAQWVTYGNRVFGQELIPDSDFVLNNIAFYVAARGQPADQLCYEVRDSNNIILARGIFAERDSLGIRPVLREVTLDEPLRLKGGELYRFALFSPGTKIEEPYHIYGFEYTYDKNIGYGGVQNSLTASFDSGNKWLRWEDADSVFSLSGSKPAA